VRDEIGSPERPSRGSQSLRGKAVAATAAVVLVGTGWSMWLRDDPPGLPPAGSGHHPGSTGKVDSPFASAGAWIVGYRGLMLTLPGEWATAGGCGSGASRVVVFPSAEPVYQCRLPRSDAPEVVVRFDDSIVGPPSLLGKTVSGGTIGGQQILLTDVTRRGSSYRQALAVPGEHFYVSVAAQRRAVVNRILESARAIPPAYTAVPPVVGSRRSVAIHRLRAAGLVRGEPKRPLASCCGRRVTTQVPAAGSVVKVRTGFRLRG
jgi:hypothetical protein